MGFILIIIPRINPAMTGFNIGCVDNFDNKKIDDVQLNDGLNHPLDKNKNNEYKKFRLY